MCYLTPNEVPIEGSPFPSTGSFRAFLHSFEFCSPSPPFVDLCEKDLRFRADCSSDDSDSGSDCCVVIGVGLGGKLLHEFDLWPRGLHGRPEAHGGHHDWTRTGSPHGDRECQRVVGS